MRTRDHNLIGRILSRDRRALSQFYRLHKPKLAGYIYSRIDNPADAEEILQDTLFAFLEKARDFEGKSSIATFLHAIAKNKIVDFYRRKKVRQYVFSELPQLESLLSSLMTPEDEFDANLLKQKVKTALSRILPRYREALVSKYQDARTVAEIARSLAVTVKGAESVLSRARKAFVEVYGAL